MAIATMTVDLVARIGGFVAGLVEAEKKADSTSAKIKKALTPDESVAKGFAAVGTAVAAGLAAVVAGTTAAVAKGVEYSGSLVDLAERLGMTVTATQDMVGAMGQLGFSSSDTTAMFEKLQKAVVDAQDPASKAAKIFKDIGVSADDLKNKSLDQIFRQVVDGTSELTTQTERAEVAMTLFGKSGAKLGELLTAGLPALDEANAKFEELGLRLGEDVVYAANSVGDSFDIMDKAFSVLSTQITADLAPVINGLIEDFAKLIGEFVKSGTASRIVEQGLAIIDAAIGTVIVTVKTMQAMWYGLQGVLQTVIGYAVNRVMSFVESIGVLGSVIAKLFKGQFQEAANSATAGWERVKAADRAGQQAVLRNAAEYAKKARDSLNAAQRQIQGRGFSLGNYELGEITPGEATGTQNLDPNRNSRGRKSGGGGMSDAAKEAKKLQEAYDSQLESYEKAMYMLGKTGEAAAIEWEIAHGKFVKLADAEKAILRERAAALDAAKLGEDLKKQLESYEQAMFMVGKTGEAATMQWETMRGKFKDLSDEQKSLLLTNAQALDAARKQFEEDEKRRKQREQDLENAKRFTDELRFQMEIYGKTAEEIERANLARDLGTALETELGQKALETLEAYQRMRKDKDDQIEAMDALRDSAKGFFSDVIKGTKSWKDALMDALDSFMNKLLDIIINNMVEGLFGQMGTAGGGMFGDKAGGWLGGLFGGSGGGGFLSGLFGRAGGGGVGSGQMYRINENGPEVLSIGGADYLMMGNHSGVVNPVRGNMGNNTTINFAVEGRIDRRTQQQIANETTRKISMANARI